MASEKEFLLHALLMGIFITFVYDLLRIFRRVVPHKAFLYPWRIWHSGFTVVQKYFC